MFERHLKVMPSFATLCDPLFSQHFLALKLCDPFFVSRYKRVVDRINGAEVLKILLFLNELFDKAETLANTGKF